jgi:hypothetical protein
MEDPPSALGVLIDCNPRAWAGRPAELELLVEHLFVFLNAHQLLMASNQLLLIGFNGAEIACLWPRPNQSGKEAALEPAGPQALRAALVDGVAQLLESEATSASLLSGATSRALCRLQVRSSQR